MRIEDLKPQQIVWHRMTRAQGGSKVRVPVVIPVTIIEIDTPGQRVLASWNGNAERWFAAGAAKFWQAGRPRRKPALLGAVHQ
jgi:hypothetical protein